MDLRQTPGTLEQLPASADAYYRDSFLGGVYEYVDTGRKDVTGARVYERRFDGEIDGYSALTPYSRYVAAVKRAAAVCGKGSSMGVPRWYRPVDPHTGRWWGEAAPAY